MILFSLICILVNVLFIYFCIKTKQKLPFYSALGIGLLNVSYVMATDDYRVGHQNIGLLIVYFVFIAMFFVEELIREYTSAGKKE